MVRIRTILTTRIFENLPKLFDFIRDGSEPTGGWDALLAALDEAQQAVNAITQVAREQGAAGSANYLQPTLTWFESVIWAAKTNAGDDAIERLFASCPDAGVRSAIQTVLVQAKKGSGDIDFHSLFKSAASSARWWEPDFQDWIRSVFIQVFAGDENPGTFDSTDSLGQIAKEIPLETIARDRKGTGEPYLPGLFIACLVNKALVGEEKTKDLITQFEKLSGLDFKKFASPVIGVRILAKPEKR
jgi:hypothetical protein